MSWNVEIDGQRHGGLHRKVRDAEAVWRDLAGTSADQVDVTWRLATDQEPREPRSLLLMSVKDPVEDLALPDQKFAPDELESRFHMLNRFNSIWGELLLSGARTHLRRFNEIMSPFAGG